MTSRPRSALAVAGVTGLALLASACGGTSGASGGPTIVTSFYPLQYVAERIAGDDATVTNLTKPGAEPHDLELTPKAVGEVGDADLVIYLSNFQPSVDDAVQQQAKETSYDVGKAADLDLTLDSEGHEGHDHGGHEGHDHGSGGSDDSGGAEHAEDAAASSEDGHDHGGNGTDPHFWLDPTRLATVAEQVGERLAKTDPDHADTYRANAKKLHADLTGLDEEFEKGLASCSATELVTSHEAFGYLAERYGLEQRGIAGLSPDQEPSSAGIAELTHFVKDHQVSTIYYETLVDPAVAKTVADESGAKTAVLDPLEGLTEDAGKDANYLSVMRSNLATLKKGQGCS